ncbi:MAG: hypothetical protein GY820_06355 [Gammaproteobacteria bacterium]|nr:hypothetical protein [Gammaproteobacteria bacterium]
MKRIWDCPKGGVPKPSADGFDMFSLRFRVSALGEGNEITALNTENWDFFKL